MYVHMPLAWPLMAEGRGALAIGSIAEHVTKRGEHGLHCRTTWTEARNCGEGHPKWEQSLAVVFLCASESLSTAAALQEAAPPPACVCLLHCLLVVREGRFSQLMTV